MLQWIMLAMTLAEAPQDVRMFVERREGCEHFAGEDGANAARRQEIDDAMRKLRCDRLEIDAQRMLGRYSGKPDVVKLIREAGY